MDVTIEEQRAFVKIMTLRHKKPSEIHQELVEACGEAAMALRTVQKWVKRVEDGESSTQDAARSGRPSTSNEEEHLEQLRALMETDRRWTCDELAEQMPQVSRTSIYRLLTDVLGMRKVAARWVPHNLSEEQKAERVTISRRLLQRQQRDSNFLDRIVAIDETWIRSYEPELKRQSAEWRHPDSPRPKKFRQKPSSMKLMMIAAYDSTGVILSHFVPQGQTVNAAYYSNYLSSFASRAEKETSQPDESSDSSRQRFPASCQRNTQHSGAVEVGNHPTSTLQPRLEPTGLRPLWKTQRATSRETLRKFG